MSPDHKNSHFKRWKVELSGAETNVDVSFYVHPEALNIFQVQTEWRIFMENKSLLERPYTLMSMNTFTKCVL